MNDKKSPKDWIHWATTVAKTPEQPITLRAVKDAMAKFQTIQKATVFPVEIAVSPHVFDYLIDMLPFCTLDRRVSLNGVAITVSSYLSKYTGLVTFNDGSMKVIDLSPKYNPRDPRLPDIVFSTVPIDTDFIPITQGAEITCPPKH